MRLTFCIKMSGVSERENGLTQTKQKVWIGPCHRSPRCRVGSELLLSAGRCCAAALIRTLTSARLCPPATQRLKRFSLKAPTREMGPSTCACCSSGEANVPSACKQLRIYCWITQTVTYIDSLYRSRPRPQHIAEFYWTFL